MRPMLIAALLSSSACYASHGSTYDVAPDDGSTSPPDAPVSPPPDMRPPPILDAAHEEGPPDAAPRDVGLGDAAPPPVVAVFSLSNSSSFLLLPGGRFYSAGHTTEGVAGRWGQLGFPRAPAPEVGFAAYEGPLLFSVIAPAQLATCGVAMDASSTVYCWGRNSSGLLGVGEPHSDRVELAPIPIPLRRVSSLVAGDRHMCAIDFEGVLRCWGSNERGQLGVARALAAIPTPTVVEEGASFRMVSTSYQHTCAIRDTGALFCWGLGEDGQLGDGRSSSLSRPSRVGTASDWTSVSAGVGHTCGVRGSGPESLMYCWGRNVSGELGAPIGTTSAVPREVVGTGWRQVTCGEFHTCALRREGGVTRAYCFGEGRSGELGLPGVLGSERPMPLDASVGFDSIRASWRYTCGVARGRHLCWGDPFFIPFHEPTTPTGIVDSPTEVLLSPPL